jgi:hypothetical protein
MFLKRGKVYQLARSIIGEKGAKKKPLARPSTPRIPHQW